MNKIGTSKPNVERMVHFIYSLIVRLCVLVCICYLFLMISFYGFDFDFDFDFDFMDSFSNRYNITAFPQRPAYRRRPFVRRRESFEPVVAADGVVGVAAMVVAHS